MPQTIHHPLRPDTTSCPPHGPDGPIPFSRRRWLGGSLSALVASAAWVVGGAASSVFAQTPPPAPARRTGKLLIVGGAEDRLQDRVILRKFVALCGGPMARILVCTAASGDPAASWAGYQPVFQSLGVQLVEHLALTSPEDANDPARVDQILQADGIWLGGGDQRRLMATLWESEAARAMHLAFHLRGASIGGTSAGAAALSRQMLAIGEAAVRPEKDLVSVDIGLGFVSRAIVDQHFSERGRLGRLLSAMAQRPDLLGVGVDEDTALLIERGRGVEVLGAGNVTLVDGRHMATNFKDLGPNERLEMLGVQLHLLPAGSSYTVGPDATPGHPLPSALKEALRLLVEPGPIRG
ncbi:MAG: cyanophycinase [Polaromonas sp.]|nr:cyanophycinase [Polaromonas sp.]